jgi:hypothetical protein
MAIKTTYVYRTLNRKVIKKAGYNPRKITSEEQERLQYSLEEFGLCEPLIYNERTNHLVSGHQRIALLDKDKGTKDYEIGMSVIDVDLATEKRLNVWLNQSASQGSFDNNKLNDMIKELEISFDELGFPEDEVNYLNTLFAPPDESILEILDVANKIKQSNKEQETEQIQFPEAPYVAPEILDSLQRDKVEGDETHDRLDDEREKIHDRQVDKFYKPKLLILFSTDAKKIHFCEQLGIDFNQETWEI